MIRENGWRTDRTRAVVFLSILSASLAAIPVWTPLAMAQTANGSIRGQVTDASGAMLQRALVVITNNKTGVVLFSAPTDDSGLFVATQATPGTYHITVTADRMKTTEIDGLIVSVAQQTAVTLIMGVGGVHEVVRVTSHDEQLATSTSDVSTLIAPSEVQNIPLQSRNVENLLSLVPGVSHGGNATQVNTSQLSINGSRTLNTEVLLNGVSTIVASTGSPALLPSPDGIDQLRFLTSNAPAEYGRTSGAVLSANTNSGTSQLHGNVYFLMRNEIANANSYFNKMSVTIANPNGLRRPEDRFLQPGGSIGGPVYIPHVYDGRKRTFFFVNYDRTLRRDPNTVTETVPTESQRIGDFSAVAMTAPIVNPATGLPFPQNKLPGFDPAAANIIALIPHANAPGTVDAANARATNNYVFQQTTTYDQLRLVVRGDHQFHTYDHLSVNLYRLNMSEPLTVAFNQPLLNSNYDCNCSDAWITSVDYTHIFTPTLVLNLNMGFFRNSVIRNPPGIGRGAATALGIASLPLDETPTISISGLPGIGADQNTDQINITNTFAPFGVLTKVIGPHVIKMGASLRKNQFNSYNPSGNPNGSLSFTGEITSRTKTSGNPNNALADFELGKVKTGNYQLPQPPTGRRNYNFGVFVQDDWRALPNLTLNFGVRYEFESPVTVANDIYTRFDPNTGALLVAGQNATRSLNIETPKLDFSPRIGFAYSIDSKTVIRGAFGTFYGTIFQNLGGQIAFPGYDVTQQYNNLGSGVAQPFSLSQGFPLTAIRNLQDPAAALVNATMANPFSISGVEFNRLSPMPLVQQYNFGVQRQLPLNLVLEMNYVGNHALHLPTVIPANLVPLNQVTAVTLANTTAAVQAVKPFPTLSTWSVVDHVGSSNYNSLQITVKRQFSGTLAVLSSYTFSKSLDDGSSIYNFSAPNGTANAQYTGIPSLREQDYAVSSIDAKHIVSISLVYTTKFGPRWLYDFVVSPTYVGETGLPINITQSSLFSNVTLQRPNGTIDGLRVRPFKNGSAIQYLQTPPVPTASNSDPVYPLSPSGPQYATINGIRTQIVSTSLGTLPRNALRGPGQAEFDASIAKSFPLYERFRATLRVDAFNVINHTNFNAPNVSLTNAATSTAGFVGHPYFNSASFGQITSAQPARQLQASIRLTF